MAPIRARQPWKGLWVTFFIATLPLHVIARILYYIPKPLRQHPKWSFHTAVGASLFKLYTKFCTDIRLAPTKSLEAGRDKGRFIVLEPASSDRYRDVLNNDPTVHPARIGAMWYPSTYDNAQDKDKLVILHFHPGGYVLWGCRPMEGGINAELLAKRMEALAFCPQYRLASHPNSHFPAALQDAVTSYNYLLELGIPPSQIIFSGDSAGANLSLALLRYIKEQGGLLPYPRACLLWSPWLDLSTSIEAIASHRNFKSDYIPTDFFEWAVEVFKPNSLQATDPYLSPLNNELSLPIPLWVHTGTAEICYDDHVAFVKNMRAIPENRIELLETPDAPHDLFAAWMVLGLSKDADKARDAAARFVQEQRK